MRKLKGVQDSSLDRIFELADLIYKREKNLTEESVADLGYIKMYVASIRRGKP